MSDSKPPAPPKPRRPTRPTPKPKVAKPSKDRTKVTAEEVQLVSRSGRKSKGDGPEGEYWEVQVSGKRAGEIFVNIIDELPVGRHASLQIFLNKPDQGHGIGRIAYRKAADASRHSLIYLHMRKANVASRIAAEAAGFVDASPAGYSQLLLKRHRNGG